MRKLTTFLMAAMLAAGTAAAAPQMTIHEQEDIQEAWNEADIPRSVSLFVSGETVNVEVKDQTLGAKFDGTEMTDISNNGFDDATITVEISEEAVDRLYMVETEEDLKEELSELRENDEITFEEHSPEPVDTPAAGESSEETEQDQETDNSITGSFTESVSNTVSSAVTSVRVRAANLVF